MSDIEAGDFSAGNGPAAACRHLRSNASYVFGESSDESTGDSAYGSSRCWCLKTMKDFGPDDEFVGKRECRNARRACYEPV